VCKTSLGQIQTSLQDFILFWAKKGINAYTCAMLITITKDGPPKVCPSSIAVLENFLRLNDVAILKDNVVFACPSWLPQHNIIIGKKHNIIYMQYVIGAKND
jgi:hypothetical protein